MRGKRDRDNSDDIRKKEQKGKLDAIEDFTRRERYF